MFLRWSKVFPIISGAAALGLVASCRAPVAQTAPTAPPYSQPYSPQPGYQPAVYAAASTPLGDHPPAGYPPGPRAHEQTISTDRPPAPFESSPESREAQASPGGVGHLGQRPVRLFGSSAVAPPEAPGIIHHAIAVGNTLQQVPYQYGGGHAGPSPGLDCSGSISYVLRSCGLLRGSMTSGVLKTYGEPGPGKWITVYAKDGHAFMTVGGLRLDTAAGARNVGPRWTLKPRKSHEFTMRHPAGL